MTKTPPFLPTTKTRTVPGALGVIGPQDALQAAYEAGTPLTLGGPFAGELVYLGHTRQTYDDGITTERIGLDWVIGEGRNYPGVTLAVYLIDATRLDGAPTIAAKERDRSNARAANAAKVMARVAAEDDRLENLAEDGA